MEAGGSSSVIPLVRLTERRQFLKVAAAGKKWAEPGLVLQVKATDPAAVDGNVIRLGFTASKKVGNSVARNRARRRLKALAFEVMTAMAKPGHDYVLIARQATLTRPFSLLRQDLEKALKRLHVLRPVAVPQGGAA
jgi:ribonuclease P protein component